MTLEKSPAQRIASLMQTLRALTPVQATHERFEEVCALVTALPIRQRPASLIGEIAQAFGKPATEISQILKHQVRQGDFDDLAPKDGWIGDYIEWTRRTEPPTVFHYFVAATAIGATLGRRVFFDKGAYKVFPNLCVMLLAPSGRCRKTSAANMGTSLYLKSGGTLLADKTTPEAFIDALKLSANALIYAPELAVFLGKQKYQEGMIPMLTALFDCPEEWTTKTIGRGETTLTHVAISALMCSTVDWLQTGIPADAFGGGFMSRFLFVVQESTPRCFPLPPQLNVDVRKDLVHRLMKLRTIKGQFTLTPEAEAWYDSWYRARTQNVAPDKQFAGYTERKPDHILRLSMIAQAASGEFTFKITKGDLLQASRILTWLEEWLPGTFDQLTSSTVGEDQVKIIRILRQAGGSMEYSTLLRRNSSRLNAVQFKSAMATLREAKQVEWNAPEKKYYLTPEGWS